MVNFMNIASKIVRALPKTEGAAGKITLGRTQLEALAKEDKKAGELIQKALRGIKEPKLDVAYKAESNYAIAGMRLRDGKKVVGNGAVSITNLGSSQAVIKYRASANNGKTLQANGFIDGGKIADGQDIAVGMSRKGGMLKGNVQIGEATAHNIQVNEQEFIDTASALNGDKLLKGYVHATNNLQTNLNKFMTKIRKTLSGEVETVKPVKDNGLKNKALTGKVKMVFKNNAHTGKVEMVPPPFYGKNKQADIPHHLNKNAVVDKIGDKKMAKNAKKFSKEETKGLKEAKIKMDEFNKNKFNKTITNFD